MANDNGDTGEDGEEISVNDLNIGISEEKEGEYLDSIRFEWCEIVRKAGTVYRDAESIEETADELGISEKEAREAVATYIHIYTYVDSSDGGFTNPPGKEYGLRYFRDSGVEPEEIFENTGWEVDSPEDVRRKIRVFVAYLIEDVDVAEINLNQEIPETPNQDLPSTQIVETVQDLSSQLAQDVATTVDIQNLIPNPNLLLPTEQLQETIQSLIQSVQVLQEVDFEIVIEEQRIRTALKNGIHGFDSPESYDPSRTSVDEESKSVGKTALENFISDIKQSNINELDNYVNRLEYGLERYEEKDYIASTHVFLSVQDGFLDYINQKTGNPPSRGHYSYNERQEAFEDEFPEVFGIQSQTVATQWGDFLNHRHKIMHGDPDAYIDENIASVALIFLVLAIYTALDLMDQN